MTSHQPPLECRSLLEQRLMELMELGHVQPLHLQVVAPETSLVAIAISYCRSQASAETTTEVHRATATALAETSLEKNAVVGHVVEATTASVESALEGFAVSETRVAIGTVAAEVSAQVAVLRPFSEGIGYGCSACGHI